MLRRHDRISCSAPKGAFLRQKPGLKHSCPEVLLGLGRGGSWAAQKTLEFLLPDPGPPHLPAALQMLNAHWLGRGSPPSLPLTSLAPFREGPPSAHFSGKNTDPLTVGIKPSHVADGALGAAELSAV